MGLQGSLPRLQVPAARPYPALDQSSPCPPSYFLKIHFNLSYHLCLGLPSGTFPPGVSHQNPIFCAALRWKFVFDGTWRLFRVETVALLVQKSRLNCKDESSFACRTHLSRSYSQHSTNKMRSILPNGILQQRALLYVSSHKGSSSGHKYQIILHKILN